MSVFSTSTGLVCYRGVGLLPHYTAAQEDLAQSMSRDDGLPIIAVPEAAGLVVKQGAARTVGPEAVWTVNSTSSTQHSPGSFLSFVGDIAAHSDR